MQTDAPQVATILHPDWLWDGATLRHGDAVAIDAAGVICAVAAPTQLRALCPTPVTRLPGQLLMPGLCDAHSHAFQRAIRGQTHHRSGASSFWTWRAAMYQAANDLDPDAVEAISARAFAELLRAGVTRVGEFHYLHHDPAGRPYSDPDELALRVVAAAQRVGLRITLLRVVYGASGIGPAGEALPLLPEQRRFASAGPDEALAATARLTGRLGALGSLGGDAVASVGLAPHSVRAVPRAWLAALAAYDGVVHSHVAEQPAEVAACRAAFGCGPLQLLADAGLVTDRFAAVHLTHPEAGDAALLQAADASVVVCPSTELDLGDGFLPLALRRGVRLAIGADSHATVEPLAEARAIELHGRAQSGERVVLGDGRPGSLAAALLTIASANGHRALGAVGGRVVVGVPADLCSVDLDRPEAEGVPPLEAVALLARPEWVRNVWVGGRLRVAKDGERTHAGLASAPK